MNDRFRCLHGESCKIIRVFGNTQYLVQCLIAKPLVATVTCYWKENSDQHTEKYS